MNSVRTARPPRRWPEGLRWGICFVLVLCLHVGGVAALMARWNEDSDLVVNAPVIMIDLAPVAVAPAITPNEVPPDMVLSREAEPEVEPEKPVEKIELPSQPKAEVTLPAERPKPIEKPKEKKPKQKVASLSSAPSPAEHRADRAAAPMPGASSRDPNALPNWKSQLVAQIERHKRYPSEAHGEAGVAQVSFSVDRGGGVHNARVVRGSGSSVLDHDALAWLARSQPLPPPPPDVGGASIPVSVPLRYNYR
jgi:periplasmic protein TonB